MARLIALCCLLCVAVAGADEPPPPVSTVPAASGNTPPVVSEPPTLVLAVPVAAPDCPPLKRMQAKSEAAVVLRFAGDVVLGNAHLVDDIPVGWSKLYFAGVKAYLQGASLNFANLEGVIAAQGQTKKDTSSGRAYAFRFPPSYAQLLKDNGFGALNLANNHSNDFGEAGFAETLNHLRQAGIVPVGLKGDIAYLNVKDLKLAFVGFAFYPRHNMIQELKVAQALVAEARQNAHYVIVSFHNGAEGYGAIWHGDVDEVFLGENRGNPVAFARAVVDAGADVVIGHGPHVLRAIECYRGKPVFYSLGNFVSVGGLSIRGFAALTSMAGVELDASGKAIGLEFRPLRFSEHKTPEDDPQEYASRLVNFLGEGAKYPGQFLKVPLDSPSDSRFTAWVKATWAGEKGRRPVPHGGGKAASQGGVPEGVAVNPTSPAAATSGESGQ